MARGQYRFANLVKLEILRDHIQLIGYFLTSFPFSSSRGKSIVSRAGSAVGLAWSEFNGIRTEHWLLVLFAATAALLAHTCSSLLKAPRATEAEVMDAATWRGRGFFSRYATQLSALGLFSMYLPVTRYSKNVKMMYI
jgi:hypothetical protein